MATLYVQNVPETLYEALRRRAQQHRRSIAAEVVSLLELNVPTAQELKSRREFLRRARRLRLRKGRGDGPFPSSEEMRREDRLRNCRLQIADWKRRAGKPLAGEKAGLWRYRIRGLPRGLPYRAISGMIARSCLYCG